jgi:proline dehydrogenase
MNASRRLLLKTLLMTPKPLVWRFARTYIAGEELDDAVRVVRELNHSGCRATVDVLGEEIASLDEVEGFVDAYEKTIDRIVEEELDATISVKPTALGLKLDQERTRRSFDELLAYAAARGCFVRIDMEDSSTTQSTLDLYRRLRAGGHENVGVVLQSYLRRTLTDARALAREGASIRLCKGIYVEPRSVAYQEFQLIRDSYVDALEAIVASEGAMVGIATHDDALIFHGRRLVESYGLPKERYEFQMLLGVDAAMRRMLVAEGHPLRVYVPFGKSWFGYSIRRLIENPRMAAHVTRNVLGFGPPSS